MNVEIREMPAQKVLCMSHTGPYFTIGTTFRRFYTWAAEHGIKFGLGVGLYYDNPIVTPPDELRSDAGGFVDLNFTIDDPAVHLVDIPAGTYAVYTHIGGYDKMGESWGDFMGNWFPATGYEYGEGAPFEIYVDDCADTPVETLRTELCIPLKAQVTA